MKLVEQIRRFIVKYCVSHINKGICITVFDKLASQKEKRILIDALSMIQTQRNFNATLEK
jgi:hypothetical protein